MGEILRVQSLYKCYEKVVALNRVNLTLNSGEVVCIVGPNGAGKTTLIETILGIRRPDGGEIYLFNNRVTGRLPSRFSEKIGILLEDARFLPWITVSENLRMIAGLYDVKLTNMDLRSVLEQVSLDNEILSRLYGKLSLGQKRKVDLAGALITNPEFLILDDPFMGLDPLARLEVLNALRRIRKERTILYTTHLLDIAGKFSDRVIMLFAGEIIAEGRPTELVSRFGGSWRVQVLIEGKELPGFTVVSDGELETKVRDLGELLDLLKAISSRKDIKELHVEPPTLQEAFENLVKRDKPL